MLRARCVPDLVFRMQAGTCQVMCAEVTKFKSELVAFCPVARYDVQDVSPLPQLMIHVIARGVIGACLLFTLRSSDFLFLCSLVPLHCRVGPVQGGEQLLL